MPGKWLSDFIIKIQGRNVVRRNKGIDIARAIAIMSVLIYHFYVLIDGNRYTD